MFVNRIEKVQHCISDQWKLWITAYLDSQPNLKEIAETLNACYSESLGVALVHKGRRLVFFFVSGKVTIRVNDIDEGVKLINSMLSISTKKQNLKDN